MVAFDLQKTNPHSSNNEERFQIKEKNCGLTYRNIFVSNWLNGSRKSMTDNLKAQDMLFINFIYIPIVINWHERL